MNKIVAEILAKRGLDESFLCPKYEDLFDPFLMQDMEAAVGRIEQARDKGEKIVIYGDYDADGVTASTVMRVALEDFGCKKVEVLLPNRFRDGYGLNDSALPRIMAAEPRLVVTVDNGSGSNSTIEQLRAQGVDTVVTDHHEIPEPPQAAVAVINPNRADEQYGKGMAGVGVAFMVARALNMRQHAGQCDGMEKWLLDLVLLGTICDVMGLRGVNRILTSFGSIVLKKSRRPGLRELVAVAGGSMNKLDTNAVGFQIGPRINAAGRMQDATVAYNLLNAKGKAEAFRLAGELDELNTRRKAIQAEIVEMAREQYDEQDKVIVVAGEWHEGVIGIAAGRLVEEYHKPAIVLTKTKEGKYKGSGRSFGDFALGEMLRELKPLLLSGGGHALACGLSLESDKIEEFKKAVNDYYCRLNLTNQERFFEQESDVVLTDFAELTPELYDEIHQMEPFGQDNAEPVLEVTAKVKTRSILKEQHLSLMLGDQDDRELKMMAFFANDKLCRIQKDDNVTLQFVLTLNEWRGRRRVEGRIVGIKP